MTWFIFNSFLELYIYSRNRDLFIEAPTALAYWDFGANVVIHLVVIVFLSLILAVKVIIFLIYFISFFAHIFCFINSVHSGYMQIGSLAKS